MESTLVLGIKLKIPEPEQSRRVPKAEEAPTQFAKTETTNAQTFILIGFHKYSRSDIFLSNRLEVLAETVTLLSF